MSKIDLTKYKTLVFDCDGVILNSNKIKTQAFYKVAKIYGQKPAQMLRDYHVKNGGVSRYEKFKYLLRKILNKPIIDEEYNRLLFNFSKEIKSGLMSCEVTKDLHMLRDKTKNSKWLIISGGDQKELREIFSLRNLDHLFDGGIFGSPKNKITILKNEIANKNIIGKSLFFGDSINDFEAAKSIKMDFIFLSEWTEVKNWLSFTSQKRIKFYKNIRSLI